MLLNPTVFIHLYLNGATAQWCPTVFIEQFHLRSYRISPRWVATHQSHTLNTSVYTRDCIDSVDKIGMAVQRLRDGTALIERFGIVLISRSVERFSIDVTAPLSPSDGVG
jgi:hypothetical protein